MLRPLSLRRGAPTYESDGYAVAPALLRRVDAHIRQVPDHAARGRADAVPIAGPWRGRANSGLAAAPRGASLGRAPGNPL